MADLKKLLGSSDKPDEESSDSGEEYDAYTEELKGILGMDDDKAKRLRDVICGLARYEMNEESDEGDMHEEPSGEKPKKKGLAIILG